MAWERSHMTPTKDGERGRWRLIESLIVQLSEPKDSHSIGPYVRTWHDGQRVPEMQHDRLLSDSVHMVRIGDFRSRFERAWDAFWETWNDY